MRALFTLLTVLFVFSTNCFSQETISPKEIVEKSYDLSLGKSSFNRSTMTITRPEWSRSISMEAWSYGQDYYLVYILEPAKERGQVFLKRETEMWNWLPAINRTIKIPPSAMGQSWLGSDFTNRDLVKQKSIITDYNHSIIGVDTLNGYECYKVKLEPKPNAPVVWGQINIYISKKGYMTLKMEYLDDQLKMIKVQTGSKIKKFGDRFLPSVLTMTLLNKKGYNTKLVFDELDFDLEDITQSYFSLQNMKQIQPK
ncbi:MAG: outer membrane lipoprotein-sorting protein [Bacteroidales bacterium]